ncbi:MAG TPA: helicase C-terminal domain-containing protein [Spirochaetota bacterium]|nr:helicase C-terminal domain-containing protein [Spirochaetota bacterium]
MKDIFGPGGHLDTQLTEYEYRESQLLMASFIHERLHHLENGIVEAGTGTGKTMAYLIPALRYASETDKKIAITTETRALQKQLVEKDIPLVQKIFRENLCADFKYAICFGSSNYPCRKRFERALRKGEFERVDLEHMNRVAQMFRQKKIFTWFDADVPFRLWEEISRDPEVCDQQRCQFASQCQFQAARREWAQADLLVMNHYLFFSNVGSGKSYLPVSDVVIFDEAHSVEQIASKQLGFSVDYEALVNLLQRFFQRGKRGIINSFASNDLRQEAMHELETVAKTGQVFFEKIKSLFINDRETVRRIIAPLDIGDELYTAIEKFLLVVARGEDDLDEDELRVEYEPAKNRLSAFSQSLKSFVGVLVPDFVYWIERSSSDLLGNVALTGRPLNIDMIMKQEVYSFYESSVFVSATLSVKNDFSFFSATTGFENGSGIVLDSPFNYREQMLVYLGADLPSPENDRFPAEAAKACAHIINILSGRCLILFTSYAMLRTVRTMLEKLTTCTIYSQDTMTASKALNLYINDPHSVLMGTHSYWQGIDLPGDLVRGVIIMRLPFAVPDTPVMEAKFERLKNEGKNPFVYLQIPEAVLKMKQGAGRLIRRGSDRGIVAILDSRIKTKSYGSIFTDSLPVCEKVLSLKDLTEKYKKMIQVQEN